MFTDLMTDLMTDLQRADYMGPFPLKAEDKKNNW